MIQELKEEGEGPPQDGGVASTRTTVKRVNHIVEKSTMYDMIVDPSSKMISTVGQDRVVRSV